MEHSFGATRCVLLIGDSESVEMRPVRQELDAVVGRFEVRISATLPLSIQAIRDGWFPDLIVVCQHWPDEFAAAEFHRLLRRAPLARWLVCQGAWCESDGRTGAVWPLAVRVPARMAAGRLRREFEILRGRRLPLPLTASRDEVFEFDAGDMAAGDSAPTAAAFSPDRELRRCWEGFLVACGCRIARGDAAPMILWDFDPCTLTLFEQVRTFCRRHPERKVVGLMGLPHPEDVDRFVACGAAAVLSKLDLLDALPQVIGVGSGSARSPNCEISR